MAPAHLFATWPGPGNSRKVTTRASCGSGHDGALTFEGQLALDRERGQRRLHRGAARVALGAAGDAVERLLHRVDGQDPEAAGNAGVELDLLDPAGRLGADVVVVVGLPPDHRSEADDHVIAPG